MRENYCFRCGCYTRIDQLTMLCGTCHDAWRAERASRTS
jgi:hypothetical protein